MNNGITKTSNFPYISNADIMDEIAQITPDYYVATYKNFLFRYISNGRPTIDTLHNYYSSIDQFVAWSAEHDRHPLSLTESDIIIYRDWLQNVKKFKDNSVKAKIMAIRKFYYVAKKYNLIKDNPADEVKVNIRDYSMELEAKFLTEDQVRELFETIYADQDDFGDLKLLRDAAMVALMVIEGCRNIEVHRLSEEDINWKLKTILIKGKSRNEFVYPCDETMEILKKYIDKKHTMTPENYTSHEIVTPTFVNLSRYNTYNRISRRGIQKVVDCLFIKMGIKKRGMSAHALRHTCGTLAYAALKDLLVVKEILRHKDPKTTAIYAHLLNRLEYRPTSVLAKAPFYKAGARAPA